MAMANDMSALLNKIEKRLGLLPLSPHLPDFVSKDKWADVIMNDTMVTFSRYFPNKFPLVINDKTENWFNNYYFKYWWCKNHHIFFIQKSTLSSAYGWGNKENNFIIIII